MKTYIYADNAATTKLDKDVYEDMLPFLYDNYANPSQKYSFSKKGKQAIHNAREIVADCINCNPNEIIFTSGGSESNNFVIKQPWNRNANIVTTEIEHSSIINSCKYMEKMGYEIKYIIPNVNGEILSNNLLNAMNQNTKLVSIMYANNEIGTVQDIKSLSMVAHEMGAIFHTDAVQAIGHTIIDVKELDIDLLSASAHKFNGPKGIGFLYKREKLNFQSLISGGSQENGYRAGTENVAYIVGLASALKKNCKKINENAAKLKEIEQAFFNQLDKSIDYIRNGINQIPGNISISFKNNDGEALLHKLDLLGIFVSTGSACNSQEREVSRVLNSIKLPIEYAKGTIRISFSYTNTIQEALCVASAINKLLV